MICTCRTEFCFICGQYAAHDSDHWMSKNGAVGCPRFLQADDPRALYEVRQPEVDGHGVTAARETAEEEMGINAAFLPPLDMVMDRVLKANEERTRREGHGRET